MLSLLVAVNYTLNLACKCKRLLDDDIPLILL